jgi:hypothetical protein
MGKVHRFRDFERPHKPSTRATFFDRSELNLLLSLYSRRVMSGEWRDYAIDQQAGMALFSVYRHSHETPLYTIAKRMGASMGSSGREREYLVCRGQEKLARSHYLPDALSIFSPPLKVVS